MTATFHNPIPANNSTFFSDLQTFLQEEDADRFRDIFTGMIVTGGTHVTGAGLTHSPDALTAYPGGHYITESGSITYPDSITHLWVICHKDTTTAVTDWTREAGTHYLFRNTGSGTTPALPVPESAILMKITTAAGAVSAVQDARVLRPWAPLHFDFANSRAGVAVDQALITDGLLHVASATAGSVTANAAADEGVFESSGDGGASILTPATDIGALYYGSPTANNRASVAYDHNIDTLFVRINGALESLALAPTETVFNDTGIATLDFRVEGDTSTHLIFADASANRAGVSLSGNLVTDGLFHIASAAAGVVTANTDADELVLEGSGNTGLTIFAGNTSASNIYFGRDTASLRAWISYDHGTDIMDFRAGSVSSLLKLSALGLILNEGGSGIFDFRVESDLNTHMLFVDGGNNSVHIDNSLLTGAGDGDLVMASNKDLRWINNAAATSANQGITFNASDELELTFETGPIVIGTFTPSHKFIVNINGTRYHIQLDAI